MKETIFCIISAFILYEVSGIIGKEMLADKHITGEGKGYCDITFGKESKKSLIINIQYNIFAPIIYMLLVATVLQNIRLEMRRLWKIIKENFPVALAMATTFLSIVYAGMRLMIYVYWMGYFKELNIDANILEINYEGNLFQVIFYGGIILLIVYIYGMLDETYKKVREQIRNKEGTWLKKLFFAIGDICSK